MKCNLCPRKCNIDVSKSIGYCGKSGDRVKIAKVMRHMWEEPIISGSRGSGAIFFSHCSLKCVYCQNYQLSHLGEGRSFNVEELAEIFKKLDNSNVENINLVTPTHYADKIVEALKIYKPKVPIVWNTSGYERVETLKTLKDFVDIFLFDFKYFDNTIAKKYSKAEDYFDVCLKALIEARDIIPNDLFDKRGFLQKGIIVRHLVLPGQSHDSKKIFDNIKYYLGTNLYVSVMSQYTPFYKAKEICDLNKKLLPLEYKSVVSHLNKLGFKKGFLQSFESATCDYTPDFSKQNFWQMD